MASAPTEPPFLVEAKGLHRAFDRGAVQALRGVDIELREGEFMAIQGPSGCGKSTLLNIVGTLDRASRGTVHFRGVPLPRGRARSAFRARSVGFVFQSFHLLPTLTVAENVEVPMLEMPWTRAERRRRAARLLDAVGLAERAHYAPTRLSGGERQRAAIARGLANGAPLLLADEPTGNLDSASARQVVELLVGLQREHGMTLLMVTHDESVAARADRVARMRDGRILDPAGD